MDSSAERPIALDFRLDEPGLGEFDSEAHHPGESEAQAGELPLRLDRELPPRVDRELPLRVDRTSAVDESRSGAEVYRRAEDVDHPRLFAAPSPRRRRRWRFLLVPVAIAAVIAGGAVSWFAMQANRRPTLPVPRSPTPIAMPRAEAPEAPALAPAPPVAVETPRAAPPVQEPRVARAAPEPTSAPIDPALGRTLAAVSQSYRALDAASLRAVWPGADTAALSQAFAQLRYQALSFERCSMRPNGSNGAVASCDVAISSAPRAGDPALQRRRESWTLALVRAGDRWTIAGVSRSPGT